MAAAADLSVRLGYLPPVDRDRIVALVRAARLPTVAPDLGEDRWLELMEVDKKNEGGEREAADHHAGQHPTGW